MDKQVKWAARLPHVREVSLHGSADLDYWQHRLAAEQLEPLSVDGRAQILIVSADSRFMGIRFRELSISVRLSRPESARSRVFLARAYNSVRFFAFCERALFHTPYEFGVVRVVAEPPASLELTLSNEVVFRAAMDSAPRQPVVQPDGDWCGHVVLPRHRSSHSRHFLAEIRGVTQVFPFLHDHDTLVIRSAAGDALAALVDSHFTPNEWLLRPDATHAKSKTYSAFVPPSSIKQGNARD